MPSLIERYLMRETGLTLLAAALALLAMVFSHRLAGYLSKAASGLLARDSIFLLLSLQAVDMPEVIRTAPAPVSGDDLDRALVCGAAVPFLACRTERR